MSLLARRYVISTHYPPAVVGGRLEERTLRRRPSGYIGGQRLRGTVGADSFALRLAGYYDRRNPLWPVARGTFAAADGGTRVAVTVGASPTRALLFLGLFLLPSVILFAAASPTLLLPPVLFYWAAPLLALIAVIYVIAWATARPAGPALLATLCEVLEGEATSVAS